jgi:hypothetical protein
VRRGVWDRRAACALGKLHRVCSGESCGRGGCGDRLDGGEACVMQANPVWRPVIAAVVLSAAGCDGGGRLCANVAVERRINCATGTASSLVVCACTCGGYAGGALSAE